MYSGCGTNPNRPDGFPEQKQRDMKTNYTFDELSKIFATVAKMDSAVNEQVEITTVYEEKESEFDAEFKKYGYSFFGAPAELHTMFDEKCRLMDAKNRAERKARKIIKDFAYFTEIGNGPCEWYEDEIKKFVCGNHFWDAEKIARYCKSVAIIIANRVR